MVGMRLACAGGALGSLGGAGSLAGLTGLPELAAASRLCGPGHVVARGSKRDPARRLCGHAAVARPVPRTPARLRRALRAPLRAARAARPRPGVPTRALELARAQVDRADRRRGGAPSPGAPALRRGGEVERRRAHGRAARPCRRGARSRRRRARDRHERVRQEGHPLGRREASVVRAAGQGGELPERRVPRLRRPPGLHARRPRAVSARGVDPGRTASAVSTPRATRTSSAAADSKAEPRAVSR